MAQYPVGGPRQPVYDLMRRLGFTMSDWSDKKWTNGKIEVSIYGTGSMAHVFHPLAGSFDCPLDDLERELSKPREEA